MGKWQTVHSLAQRIQAEARAMDRVLGPRTDVVPGASSDPPLLGVSARTTAEARPHATVQPAAKPRCDRPPAIIVVEDDADDFLLLRRALVRGGATARIWWVQNPRGALATLADVAKVASGICVVIDVCLTGTDGFDLFDSMKARVSACPVHFVFLTGLHDPRTRERARLSGADGFFTKSPEPQRLMEIARAVDALAASRAGFLG